MINNFQNPTVENFYWNIFIKKVFLPWYLPKSGQLSLISCQINYWPRSKNWKIFLSRLSKTFTEFCVFFPNSLARVLFKNGLYFFRVPKLSPQSIFEKSAVLKTYYPVPVLILKCNINNTSNSHNDLEAMRTARVGSRAGSIQGDGQ